MKKITLNLFAFILAICASQNIYAQDVIFEESFATGMGDFVVEGNNGPAEDPIWYWNETKLCAAADAYGKIGEIEKVENYLVSPEIQLGDGCIVTFNQDNLYFGNKESQLGFVIRQAGSTEWTPISVKFSEDNGNLCNVGDIDIPAEFNGMKVQFGFRYMSPGSEVSGIFQVNKFIVKKGSGVDPEPEPEPEDDVDVFFKESFMDSMGEFTVEGFNGDSSPIWFQYSDDNMHCVIADGFNRISGGEITNYLVSPEIQLMTANRLNFKQMNYYFTDIANQAGVFIRKAGETEWTSLNVVLPNTNGIEAIGEISIPADFDNQKIQLGFKYTADGSDASGMIYLTDITLLSSDAAGIEDVIAESNGDGKMYDLQGRRIVNPTKGLYIVNGKKIVIR